MVHNSNESQRKVRTIARLEQEIKINEHFLSILDNCNSVIGSFDGKVFNKRLLISLNEITPNPHKIHFSFGSRPGWSEDAIELSDYDARSYLVGDNWFYLSSYEEYIPLATTTPPTGGQPRIDSKQTLVNLESLREQLQKDITDLQSDIENYDNELQAWQTIKSMVEDYQSAYSYRLRGDINMRR